MEAIVFFLIWSVGIDLMKRCDDFTRAPFSVVYVVFVVLGGMVFRDNFLQFIADIVEAIARTYTTCCR